MFKLQQHLVIGFKHLRYSLIKNRLLSGYSFSSSLLEGDLLSDVARV